MGKQFAGQKALKNSNKPTETSERLYIANFTATGKEFCDIIRKHWSIENKLHWCLDVSFDEDMDIKRTENASQNFFTLNKIALNLQENAKTLKVGIKGKRLKAGWDNNYLEKLINFQMRLPCTFRRNSAMGFSFFLHLYKNRKCL